MTIRARVLPKSWRWRRLDDVGEAIRGITFSAGEASSAPFFNSIACLTTSGVQDAVAWDSRRFVPRHAVSSERQVLRQGDVLISTANSKELVGKSCLVGNIPFPCTFGAFVTVYRCNPEAIDHRYISYWMRSSTFLSWAYQASSNTTNISNLRVSELLDLEVPVPPHSEQRRLAGLLDRADRLRRLRRYALELSETYLRSVFLEMFVAGSDSDWPQVTIEAVADSKKASMRTGPFGSQLLHSEFVDSGVAVLGIDNVVQNRFVWAKPRFITQDKYQQLKRYTVFSGDVLITIMATNGRCAVAPDYIPLAINTKHLCCITLDQSVCLPHYLHSCFLHHPHVQKQLGISERGAIMPGLNMEIIKDLVIPLPPVRLQDKFTNVAKKHAKLAQQNRQAEHLFQTLLHQAFAGKL